MSGPSRELLLRRDKVKDARIAELEAENERLKEQLQDDFDEHCAGWTRRAAQAEAALSLSREQTEYANDAMMAMCKRAEKAEDIIEHIRQSVVRHKQEAALYNNEREYECLTAMLRIIDELAERSTE